MSTPTVHWALSPLDYRAHAVNDADSDAEEIVTRCGRTMSAAAGIDAVPRGSLCAACALAVAPDIAERAALIRSARDAEGIGPWFGPPDRSPVEHSHCSQAPGDRSALHP